MKYAIVNGERREAEQGLSGLCPCCEQAMVAKCGKIKIKHWAHKGKLTCDPWWENETEWHRNWKSHFPKEWQEVVHYAENGEKHIADIKTDQNWVIEFQHSYLKPEERKSRNDFYKKLVWVVDGKRLKRDADKFSQALNSGVTVGHARKINPGECSLLRDWNGSHAAVFFDFGISPIQPEKSVLWILLPKSFDGMAYVFPYSRTDFIEICRNGTSQKAIEFAKLLQDWPILIQNYYRTQEHNQRIIVTNAQRARLHRPLGRRHFRF